MPRKTAFLTVSIFCLTLFGSAAAEAAPMLSQAPMAAPASGNIILTQMAESGSDTNKQAKAARKSHRKAKEAADKTEDKAENKAKRHYNRKAKEKETAAEPQTSPAPQTQTQKQEKTQKNSMSKTMRQAANGDNCPCSGGSYCVGPRNGHYCYSASGKKRYLKHN